MVNTSSLERGFNDAWDESAMPPRRPEEGNDEIHEISRAIGQLQADLQSIIRTQADDRKFAASYRTDVRKQVGEIAALVSGLAQDVTAMKPEVEIAKQAREEREVIQRRRARQMKTAGTLIGLAVGLATFGRTVIDWFVALIHHILPGIRPP